MLDCLNIFIAEMTSRERVLAALDHQETDRIPIAMACGESNHYAHFADMMALMDT